MLYLEHLNLVVRDIPQSLTFYQAAFPHWLRRGGGTSAWYGKARNWLHFGDDYQYLALSDHGDSDIRDHRGYQVGLSHFAFVVNNLPLLTQRLVAAGFSPAKGEGEPGVRNNTYFTDPDGYEVEFIEYLSDVPSIRNNYND
jgi:catechol 2,3-dioxygenase-like lactoylglutathione lyase family enzyme